MITALSASALMADAPSSESLGSPSVDSLQYAHVSLALGSLSPQVNLPRAEQTGRNTSPLYPLVMYLPDTAQRALNSLYRNGIWLAHIQLIE